MRCTARRYFISLLYKLGQVSKKMFSFPLSFALGLEFAFILIFFSLLVRFFPQRQVFQQKRLYSSCQAFLISLCNLILFSGENIACRLHIEHFCCFTNFSSLKLNIMAPKINTVYQVLMFLDYSGQV